MLDFGIIIQPANLSKYSCLHIPASDTWGVVMRKDSPLAKKKYITKKDLLNLPLICSRQAISNHNQQNEYIEWFGEDFEKLNIVTTYNLVYNAAVLVERGIGYAVTIDKIANTSESSKICFRPLKPQYVSNLDIIWKKKRLFSPAAELFFKYLKKHFS